MTFKSESALAAWGSVFSTLLFLDDSRLSRPQARTTVAISKSRQLGGADICGNPQTSTSNRLTGWAAVTIHRWAAERPRFTTSRVTSHSGNGVTDSEVSQVFLQPRVIGLGPGCRRPIKPTHERAFTMQRTSLTQPTRSLTTLIMKAATGTVLSPSRSESGLCQCRGNSK